MPLTDIRIVLVDDEAGVLKALTMVLQAFGAQVTGFPRADLALNALRASHAFVDPVTASPDIIVSDLRMPGISGVEFFTALRSFGNTTPFLLMSGHAAGDEISEALTLGVSGFVAKPFAPPQLISEITRFASTRSARSNTL
jgi:CheY-like chemotaxis protein